MDEFTCFTEIVVDMFCKYDASHGSCLDDHNDDGFVVLTYVGRALSVEECTSLCAWFNFIQNTIVNFSRFLLAPKFFFCVYNV